VRNLQLATVTLPSYRGGCGGIDLFTGGFSFINSQQLVDAMKNIANNAMSYAFILALKTVSPLIENTTSGLQSWINRINSTNINSCETGAALVGALWPKTDIAQQEICESVGTSNNIFSDWAAARQGCGSAGQRSAVLKNGKQSDQFKDMILEDTNLAWQAIQKNAFLSADKSLAELFMSLSGTIITKNAGNDDQTNSFMVLPSLASDKSLIKALLQGGHAEVYHCDTQDQCLNPTVVKITISEQHALGTKVHALLLDMTDHIYNDTALTTEEIGLLESTGIPVYKMLNVEAAYYHDSDILDLSHYSNLIASSIVYQYIHESLQIVQTSASVLQYPDHILKEFMQGISQARSNVTIAKDQNFKELNQTLTLIENTRALERQLAGTLAANLQGNLNWARSM
jgi:conjugative transfer pilus assembly protein TraH